MRVKIGGLTLGHVADGVAISEFDRVGAVIAARQQVPFSDVTYAGADWLGSELWTFTLIVKQEGLPAAVAASNALESVWRDPANRAPGVLVALDYDPDHGERGWRRVYGRCGRFAGVTPDVLAAVGAGRILAEFEVLDPRKYSTLLRSQTVGLVAESTGGIIFGLVFPMTTTISGGARSRFVEVGGDAPTPLAVTFHGPLVDPEIEIGGQVVGIEGAVAADLPITVDARTQTVTRGDGVAVPGRVTRRSRLDALEVAPGVHEVVFSGVAPTGTGYVEISWRDATWGL